MTEQEIAEIWEAGAELAMRSDWEREQIRIEREAAPSPVALRRGSRRRTMAEARPVLSCSVERCPSAWYDTGGDHRRAIRRAVKRGWSGSEAGTGCLCGRNRVYCPTHAHLAPPTVPADGAGETRGGR